MAGQGLAITAAAGSGNMPRFFMRSLYAIFTDVARNLIVGDIHGQYSMLMKALDRAGFNPDSDVLYTTGDIADKGPDSAAVVAFLHSLPDCRMVMGNHDVWLENYLLTGRAPPIWLNENGGSATVTITPNEGYILENVQINGKTVSVGEDGSYRIENIYENITVSAQFAKAEAPAEKGGCNASVAASGGVAALLLAAAVAVCVRKGRS